LFLICAAAQGPTGCLSDHCAVYGDHCVEIAGSTETSETADTTGNPEASAECGDGVVQGNEECDDGNSSEMDACTTFCTAPQVPTLELSVSQIKQFEFSWSPVLGATHYRLFERTDVGEPFVQLGEDLSAEAASFTMPLHFRAHASYKLFACDASSCLESAVVDVDGNLAEAVGYFKGEALDEGDHFGESVAVSDKGDTLAVGAPGDSEIFSGAVHVFVRSGAIWSPQLSLAASHADENDDFGAEVALSNDGDTLAIGAPQEDSGAAGIGGNQADNSRDDSGAVYVFVRSDGSWSQQAYVKASDPDDQDWFGANLTLSGDGKTLAVAAREGDDVGAVYVFVREGDDWSQQVRLEASNKEAHDRFGTSLALSDDGNTLAVGASHEDSNATGIDGNQGNDSADDSGAAYVFVRSNGVWSQQAYVKASNTGAHDLFGASVALSGDGSTLAVGAPGVAGAAYVFARVDGTWSEQAHANGIGTEPGDSFGESVALSDVGDVMAVGARHEASHAIGIDGDATDNSTPNAGAVHVLVRSDGVWSQRAYVKAPNTGEDDEFGVSVALSGDAHTLAVGAPGESSNSPGIGGDQTDNSSPKAGAVFLY
jgi:cysteine-rich repeat protein